MEKTLEQAAAEFNRFTGNVGYAAGTTDEEEIIEIFFNGIRTGLYFEDIATFEQWAYEGGDSV